MNKLEALVELNGREALVVRDDIYFEYEKYGDIIIGIDETDTFLVVYVYDWPSKGFKAFGGREFDIELKDGEIIHCNGQWWYGGANKAIEVLGRDIISVAVGSVNELTETYVFNSMYMFKDKLEELIYSYEGRLYEYDEYRKILREE